jgi:hypothetical protein
MDAELTHHMKFDEKLLAEMIDHNRVETFDSFVVFDGDFRDAIHKLSTRRLTD